MALSFLTKILYTTLQIYPPTGTWNNLFFFLSEKLQTISPYTEEHTVVGIGEGKAKERCVFKIAGGW